MRRLMIPMSEAILHRLMAHSRRTRVPISALVMRAVEQWLGPEEQAAKAFQGNHNNLEKANSTASVQAQGEQALTR